MPERLVVASTGRTLAATVRWARTARARARGLLGTAELAPGEALAFVPARQLHTFGMRYAIDVCFCDRDWRVLRVARMRPYRITRWVAGARYAVETAAGAMESLRPGDQLSLESSER